MPASDEELGAAFDSAPATGHKASDTDLAAAFDSAPGQPAVPVKSGASDQNGPGTPAPPQKPEEEDLLAPVDPHETRTKVLAFRDQNASQDARRAAEVLRASIITGMPEDLVDADLDSAKKQADDMVGVRWDEVSKHTPNLANALADNPHLQAAAKPDMEHLQKLDILSQFRNIFWPDKTYEQLYAEQKAQADYLASNKAAALNLIPIFGPVLSYLSSPAHETFKRDVISPVQGLAMSAAETQAGLGFHEIESALDVQPTDLYGKPTHKLDPYGRALVQAATGSPEAGATYENIARKFLSGLWFGVPIVGEHAFDSMDKQERSDALDSVVQTYGKWGAKGIDLAFGLLQGPFMKGLGTAEEAGTVAKEFAVAKELGPMASKVVELGGKTLGSMFEGSVFGASQAATEPGVSPGEAILENAVTAGILHNALAVGGHVVHEALAPSGVTNLDIAGVPHEDTGQALIGSQLLAQQFDLAAKTKLKDSAPDALEKLVHGMDPKATVSIPAQRWTEYFQAKRLNPLEEAAKVAEDGGAAYRNAAATGGDFVIPRAKAIKNLAGTWHDVGLAQDMRAEPNLPTLREAQQSHEEIKALIQKAAAERGPAFQQEMGAVKDAFSKAAMATKKVTQTQANAFGTMLSEHYGAMAARTGQSVGEVARIGGAGALKLLGPDGETAGRQALEQLARVTSAPEGTRLLQERAGTMSKEAAPELIAREAYNDRNTGLPNERAAKETPAPADKPLTAHVSVKGTKYVNDEFGHDEGDLLYRTTARSLASAEPTNLARREGDFTFHVKDQAELESILAEANKAQDKEAKGYTITGAVGKDWAEAKKNHIALKEAAEKEGTREPRGEKPLGAEEGQPVFSEERAVAPTPEHLVEQVERMGPKERVEHAYVEPESGILNSAGREALPRKAHQAIVDIKSFKEFNKDFGEEAGDRAITELGAIARQIGGSSFNFTHLHGDEYALEHDDPQVLAAHLDKLVKVAHDVGVDLTKDGKDINVPLEIRYGQGPLGAGKPLELAEADLLRRKAAEEPGGGAIPRVASEATLGRGAQPQGFGGLEEAQRLDSLDRGQAVVDRMRSNKAAAQAWLDYAAGRGLRPIDVPLELKKRLADEGIWPQGEPIPWDIETGRSLERALTKQLKLGDEPEELKRARLSNLFMKTGGKAGTYGYMRQEGIAHIEGQPVTYEQAFEQPRRVEDTKPFKDWFADSKVVDEGGRPQVVFHGTTGDFESFSRARANPESDMGAGFYFTNEPNDVGANYAGEGPDLKQKIELEAERIASETDRDYSDPDVIAEARAKFMAHEGATVPVYLSIKKPFELGGDHETMLDIEYVENKDGDIVREKGALPKFISALKKVAEKYHDGSTDDLVVKILDHASGDSISASELYGIIKSDDQFNYYTDDTGRLVSKEILRQALKKAGFDGVIDRTVDEKFGSNRRIGKQMEGVTPETTHYIAFEPSQIKSAVGNRGTFNPKSRNILEQGARRTPKAEESLEDIRADARSNGVALDVYEHGDKPITLSRIVVPEEGRGQGVGTEYMERLNRYADSVGKTIALSPATDFGATSKGRLVDFYKSLGFVENKGRNRDLEISESMYRRPKQTSSFEQGAKYEGEPPEFLGEEPEPQNEPRGKITFGTDETGRPNEFAIHLLEGADKSTLFHEAAHFLTWSMHNIATSDIASPEIKADYDTLLKHMGYESPEQRIAETVEHKKLSEIAPAERTEAEASRLNEITAKEEMASHAFEQYITEGKAPSKPLARVFSKLREWMLNVYKGITGIAAQYESQYGRPLELSPEVREVFDRLLAQDRALKDAETQTGGAQDDAKAVAQMTKAELKRYRELGGDAQVDSEQRIQEAQSPEKQKAIRADRAKLTEEAGKSIDQRPEYAASHFLEDGTVPDGMDKEMLTADGRPLKLDRAKFSAEYGMDAASSMPIGSFSNDGSGISADDMATALGFESARAMVDQLTKLEPRDQAISKAVQQSLDLKYGTEQERLTKEALAATHSPAALEREIVAFRAYVKQIPSLERKANALDPKIIRQEAARIIGEHYVDQLDPAQFARNERRLMQEAARADGRGDLVAAADARQMRIVQKALFMEARDAKAEIDKARDRIENPDDRVRANLGKADPTYRDVHDQILRAAQLSEQPPAEGEKSLDDMLEVAKANAQDMDFDVDEIRQLLGRPKDFGSSMTVDEARNVAGAVENVRRAARNQVNVTMMGKEVERDSLIGRLVDALKQRKAQPALGEQRDNESALTKLRLIGQSFDASLTDIRTFAEMADGGADGPWHDLLINNRLRGRDVKTELTERFQEKVNKMWEEMPKEIKDHINDKVDLDNLPPMEGFKDNRTRSSLYMMFLNWGEDGNRQRLMDGRKWERRHIETALSQLKPEEASFLQQILDSINELYKPMADVHERETGLRPQKLQAVPITINDKEYAGGYFPAKYDYRGSQIGGRQLRDDVTNVQDIFSDTYQRPAISASFAKQRADKVVAPIDLSWSNVQGHVSQVIHDIAYREFVKDTASILLDPDVRDALKERLGVEREKQFIPWLQAGANQQADSIPAHLSAQQRVFGWLGSKFATQAVGWSFKSAAGLLTDVIQPVVNGEVSGPRMMSSLMKTWNPFTWGALRESALELSSELRYREQHGDNNMMGAVKEFGKQGSIFKKIGDTAFAFHSFVDKRTATILFDAKYNQELAAGSSPSEAAAAANDIVAKALPSPDIFEKAAILRDRRGLSGFITFYGYANKIWNMNRRAFDRMYLTLTGEDSTTLDKGAAVAKFAGTLLARAAVPGIMGALLRGQGPSDDEDKAEWAAREALSENLHTIPILGSVIEAALQGHHPAIQLPPQLSMAQHMVDRLWNMAHGVKNDDDEAAFFRKVESVAGFFTGVPTSQAHATLDAIAKLSSGEWQPQDPGEALGGLLYGVRKGNPMNPFSAPGRMLGQ